MTSLTSNNKNVDDNIHKKRIVVVGRGMIGSSMFKYLCKDDNIDYIIPGNDDALRSINLYKNYFLATIQDATNFQDITNAKDENIQKEVKKDDK